MNCVLPVPGFLETLRAVCDQHGSVLIFDEVMTGFRVALGGAQALYGIKPDLTTLGKIVGGGMPVGAFGGRRDIMERIAPLGPVYQAGTLSGNPLAMAAGVATLAGVSAPGFHASLARENHAADGRPERGGARRGRAVHDQSRVRHVRPVLHRQAAGALLREVMACDVERFKRFFHAMLERGHLSRAVGVRSRLHFGGAFGRRHRRDDRGGARERSPRSVRTDSSDTHSRCRTGRSRRPRRLPDPWARARRAQSCPSRADRD